MNAHRHQLPSAAVSPDSTAGKTFGPDADIKYKIPDLPQFSGVPTAYYKWKQEVKYILRQYALDDGLTDPEKLFGALSRALVNGSSRSLVLQLENQGNCKASDLSLALEQSFNTPLVQANFVIHAVHKLIKLKLDAHTPTGYTICW